MYEQILLLVSVIVFVLFLYQKKFKSRENLPPGPSAHALLGFIPLFLRANTVEKLLDLSKELLDQYNGLVYGETFGIGGICFISRPAYLGVLFQKDVTEKPDVFYDCIRNILGNTLFTLNGETWKTRSKMAAPVFKTKNIRIVHETIQRYTERLIENLNQVADGQNKNLSQIFNENALRLTVETLAGFDQELPNTEEINRIIDGVKQFIDLCNYKFTHLLSSIVLHKLGYKWPVETKFNRTFQTYMNDLWKTIKPAEYDFNSDHQTYTKVFYSNLSDDELMEEIKGLAGASFETSTSAFLLILTMLAMFPQEQKRVCEEQSEIFGDSLKPADFEDLPRMEYLEACINETLRLFPIGPIMAKTLTSNAQVGNYCIPKETTVLIPIQLIHRDPDVWHKPDDFYPQHFLDEKLMKNRPKYAYLAFSAGPRECVGKKYAMTMMKTMLSQIVRTYHISTDANNLDDIKVLRLFTVDTSNIEVKLKPKITC